MARKRRSELARDVASAATDQLGIMHLNAEPVSVVAAVPLVDQAPVIATVVRPTVACPLRPVLYRVVKGGRIMHRGFLTHVKPDKIIDERLYDVESLRGQGIVMVRMEE